MLDHQRSYQSKVFKPDKWREIEGAQRKQRIKSIYGNTQDITNRLMYFQELKPPIPSLKSSSMNPSNSRRRLGSEQSVMLTDDKRIIPKSVLRQVKKNRQQDLIDQSQTLQEKYNIIYNMEPLSQTQEAQMHQDTLFPLYKSKQEGHENNLELDSKSKQMQTLEHARYTTNLTPQNRVDTTPNNRKDSQGLLIDFLANTKLLQKYEYRLTTNQSITPTRGREDSIISKKRKKKKSKSKKNLKRFHSPNLNITPTHVLEHQRANRSVIEDYPNSQVRYRSPQQLTEIVDQYAGKSQTQINHHNLNNQNESTHNLHQNHQNQNKLQNFKGFDVELSPENDFSKTKSANKAEQNNDKKDNNMKNKTILGWENLNKSVAEENQGKEGCVLPSLNQQNGMGNPEMKQFREDVDRTLAPQAQFHYGFVPVSSKKKINFSAQKLRPKRDMGYNSYQQMFQRSKSPELVNVSKSSYKNQFVNKSVFYEPYEQDNLESIAPTRNVSAKINNNKTSSTDINRNNQNRVSEIFQQKYSHEVPSIIYQPIRQSQKFKEDDQASIEVGNEIDQQARNFSTNLLIDHNKQQYHLQQQYKKQQINRYKIVQKTISPNSRIPIHLPNVNQFKQYQTNSIIANSNQYQYLVEQEPKFQIKVVPKYLLNSKTETRCTCHDNQETGNQSPNRVVPRDYQGSNTKVYSKLEYSQNSQNEKPISKSYQNTVNPTQTSQSMLISSQDHLQYLEKMKNQNKSSSSLIGQEDNVVIEKDGSPVRTKKDNSQKPLDQSPQMSKRNSKQQKSSQSPYHSIDDANGKQQNQNKNETNPKINSHRSSVSHKSSDMQEIKRISSKPPSIVQKSSDSHKVSDSNKGAQSSQSQSAAASVLKKTSSQDGKINKQDTDPKVNSRRSSQSKKDQLDNDQNRKSSSQIPATRDRNNSSSKVESQPQTKQSKPASENNQEQKPPLRKQSIQKQNTVKIEKETDDKLKQNIQNQQQDKDNNKTDKKDNIQDKSKDNHIQNDQQHQNQPQAIQQQANTESKVNKPELKDEGNNNEKPKQSQEQVDQQLKENKQNQDQIGNKQTSNEQKIENKNDDKTIQNKSKDSQKMEEQKKEPIKEKAKQISEMYQYQLNINYNQKEAEEIYNSFVQFTVKKRRECCLEPFFQKAEHVIWVDNFQIKIDASFQNQMLFKMRLGNQEEAKIFLKYEDQEITNQWAFTKLKDNLKCLPLQQSEGIVLNGKNTKSSLRCYFSLVYLQSLKFETADLDYQYVNYSEELMKIIKSLCINTYFSSILSKNENNPCIQINNFPVFFPNHNTIAYENEVYLDIEEMNSSSKRQNKQYSDLQVLRLIHDMLENIKKVHQRNITINNININNIVYSRESNTFKLLSYVHSEFNEDNLTPRHSAEIEQKYHQNPIYFSLKKFNQYKRDIYALGICGIIFKFQLTDYSINQSLIQEKIEYIKQNPGKSLVNQILVELIEQEQVLRSSEAAKTYIEKYFSNQDKDKVQALQEQQSQIYNNNQNEGSATLSNLNKSLGIGGQSPNLFEGFNFFDGIDQKQQSVSSNQQISELQILRKSYEHCGKINSFFTSYQAILDTSRQTYGLSSSIYLENLIDFYFEALHYNQNESVAAIIDFIEKENLFVFISQIPKNQQALRFMVTTAFKFILENNIDKSMKYFDRALALQNLSVQDLFQLNLNLGILASQKQKKPKSLLYLQQAQYVAQSIKPSSINLAAPYLLSGVLNEDEKDLEIALQIKTDNGEDPTKVQNLLFKIGSLCLKKKNFSKGEDIFRTFMQNRGDVNKETQKVKSQFFQAKLNLAFCMLGTKADHPILNILINDYLVELRQIYGQQSKETLYALYEISEVLVNLKVDVQEIIPIYTQCKQIASLINENQLITELDSKLQKLQAKN